MLFLEGVVRDSDWNSAFVLFRHPSSLRILAPVAYYTANSNRAAGFRFFLVDVDRTVVCSAEEIVQSG